MNKNSKRLLLLAVLALSVSAFALNQFYQYVAFFGGVKVAPATLINSAPTVTRILKVDGGVDLASVTTTCTETAAMTLTGARLGDPCIVGSSAAFTANLTYSCYVSANDAVKVRVCAAGTAADAASAGFTANVISTQ